MRRKRGRKCGVAVLAIKCMWTFWAVAQKGIMSCRTWGELLSLVYPSVCTIVHPIPRGLPLTPSDALRDALGDEWLNVSINHDSSVVYRKSKQEKSIADLYSPWTIFYRTLLLGHLPLSLIKSSHSPFLFIFNQSLKHSD